MLTVNVELFNFLAAVVLPILTGIVTNRLASGAFKATVLLALSAIAGVLTSTYVSNNGDFEWKRAVISAGMVFIASVGTHFGFLKPRNVTGADGAVNKLTPKGLGKPTTTV